MNLVRRLLILIAFVMSFLGLRCTVEEGSFVGPAEETGKYIFFKRFIASQDQLFTEDSTTVLVELTKVTGQPADSVIVNFSSTLGSIVEKDTTDSAGIATVNYYSGILTGVDTVSVQVGEKTDTLFILILDRSAKVILSSDTTTIIADGVANVRLQATVVDDNQQPVNGVSVFFSVDEGLVDTQGTTDQDGITYATLTGIADSTDVIATVKASLTPLVNLDLTSYPGQTQMNTNDLKLNHRLLQLPLRSPRRNRTYKTIGVKGPDGKVVDRTLGKLRLQKTLAEGFVDSLQITYKGIKAQLYFDRAELLANGSDLAQVTVTVFETSSGIPVAGYSFQVRTSRGILSGSPITDDTGQANLQLRSSYIPGTAVVTVILGAGLTFSDNIPFVSSHPSTLTLNAATTSLLADGVTTTTLTASVRDTLGNPVTGAEVAFQSAIGTLSESNVTTDENGVAVVTHTSPSSIRDTSGYVTCNVSGALGASRVARQGVSKNASRNLTRRNVRPYPILKKVTTPPDPGLTRNLEIRRTLTKSRRATLGDSVLIDYRGVTISVSAETALLPADGSSSTSVTATLFETTAHSPLTGANVYFTTTNGTITGTVSTDANGVATATLIASSSAEVTTVIASFGMVLQDTVTVEFYSLEPTQVTLNSATATLLADGRDTTQITALITDIQGNPVSLTPAVFHTSIGTLLASTALTDSNGSAVTFFISPARHENSEALVDVSLPTFLTIVDTTTLTLQGITIGTNVTDQAIIADGQTTTSVNVIVRETGTNVAIPNEPVIFATTLGTITGPTSTDVNGNASAVLTSGTVPGLDTIYVAVGHTLYDTVTVSFLSPAPQSLVLTSNTTSLLGDGTSSTPISATVTDTLGDPVPGTSVVFASNLGVLSDITVTADSSGVATSTLTSLATPIDQIATVTAFVEGDSAVSDIAQITFRGVTINSSADPVLMSADGQSTALITVMVMEANNNNAVPNEPVTFAATLGTITGSSNTDANGIAVATLTSGTTAGYDSITIGVGNTLYDTVTVELVGHTPHALDLTSSSAHLVANGEATAQLNAWVTDTLANPMANTLVIFNTTLGSLAATTVTTDSNGLATTTLTSIARTIDTSTTVTAIVIEDSTVLDTLTLVYRGVTLNVSATPELIAADGVSMSTISILIQETTTGNPLANQSYTLSTTNGIISAGGTTNTSGIAEATLTSSTTPGTAAITVTAGVSNSVNVTFLSTDPTTLLLTGNATSVLGDGEDTLALSATVTDTFGNPVTGSSVVFTTTLGDLEQASTTTNSNGIATNRLTSTARLTDTTVVITATAAGIPAVQDNITVIFRGITFTISAQDSMLLADGNSTTQISAQVKESTNGHPINDRTVFWSTNLGTIPGSTITDSNGNTSVTLTSGTTAGTALIQGSFGSTLTTSTTVMFIAPSDSSLVLSWFNPEGTGDGNGDGTDDLQVSALFTDQSGLPIVGADIQFSLNPNTMGTIISPATTDNFGTATTTLRYSSQYIGSTIRVTAVNGSSMGYIDIILPALN